jgi:hypothetical protein
MLPWLNHQGQQVTKNKGYSISQSRLQLLQATINEQITLLFINMNIRGRLKRRRRLTTLLNLLIVQLLHGNPEPFRVPQIA